MWGVQEGRRGTWIWGEDAQRLEKGEALPLWGREVGREGCEALGFGARLPRQVWQHRAARWGWQSAAWSVGPETSPGGLGESADPCSVASTGWRLTEQSGPHEIRGGRGILEGSHRKGKLEAPRPVPQEFERERKAGAVPLREHHSGRAGSQLRGWRGARDRREH